jgi:hypothetical protein
MNGLEGVLWYDNSESIIENRFKLDLTSAEEEYYIFHSGNFNPNTKADKNGEIFTGDIYVNKNEVVISRINPFGLTIFTPNFSSSFESIFDVNNGAFDFKFNGDTSFTVRNQEPPTTKYSPSSAYHLTRKDYVDTKESSLGNPTKDGQVLSSLIDGTRSWIDVTSAVWGNITGDISNQTDLVTELGKKSDIDHNHEISDINNLQSELDSKIDDGDAYLKTDHISVSTGVSDGGKPIVLNSQGKVDSTMIDVNTFYYVGTWDPSAGQEYPDTSSETPGAFWSVQGMSADYTFTSGDLQGQTISNGNFMIWGDSGWSIIEGSMDPQMYYKLDGTQAITAPFAGGNQQLKNIADGTDNTDAVTLSQLTTGLSEKFDKTGGNITGDVNIVGGNLTIDERLEVTKNGYFGGSIRVGYGDNNNSNIVFRDPSENGGTPLYPSITWHVTDQKFEIDDAYGKNQEIWHAGNFTPDIKVDSDTSAVSGSQKISNMIALTQTEYDAITPDPYTFYVIVS